MRRSRATRLALAFALLGFGLALPTTAAAQFGGGGGGRGGGPGQGGPTQSRPTRNKSVGPQRGAGGEDEEPQGPSPSARPGGEPTVHAPQDPLAIPDGVKEKIGTDYDGDPPGAEGKLHRSFFPYYEERRGDYRMRLVPPLYLEHTRGLDPDTGANTEKTDRESLTGLLFYQRRSPKLDADVLFPALWRVRDRENHVFVLGPLAHREAPHEHDNWLAPLLFEGSRKDGGYFHAPLLLTTSRWNEKGAFTLVGPFFRDRTLRDVDWGLAPIVFGGDNGDVDGARKKYWLIPPLLTFHREREIDESSLTVVGPVIAESNPKRSIFDVAPLFFWIKGKPESGGVRESHMTLFPFFHYGTSPEKNLLVLPGYIRRVTPTADTMITPFFSHATTRNNATSLTMAGPLLPVYYRNTDTDVGYSALGIFPFYYGSSSPKGRTLLTPLFGRFESYNISRTYWAFPNITYTRDIGGWETNIHPLVYIGRDKDSSHTVLAPVFWDFANKKGRTTVGFPLYWRFADTTDGTVTQVAANTLYRERRVPGGTDWQFHLLPLFSYGQNPTGYWWNVLFGLAGYDRDGETSKIKALWMPITVSSPPADRNTATR
ncbi:MAG: hypothetical protein BGO98_38940 [Myxococcales bacterium 68-20]|nr:MAG: hypothetical protein BGO98_38940 [Myxococcales bacterium 68-20]